MRRGGTDQELDQELPSGAGVKPSSSPCPTFPTRAFPSATEEDNVPVRHWEIPVSFEPKPTGNGPSWTFWTLNGQPGGRFPPPFTGVRLERALMNFMLDLRRNTAGNDPAISCGRDSMIGTGQLPSCRGFAVADSDHSDPDGEVPVTNYHREILSAENCPKVRRLQRLFPFRGRPPAGPVSDPPTSLTRWSW